MSRKPGFFMLFAVLALISVLAMPGMAEAQVTDQCADGSIDKSYQGALAAAAQQQIGIANQTLALFGAIDIQSQYCWQNIQNALHFAGLSSDPLNLIWSAIEGQLLSMLNAVCASVVGTISSLKSTAISQLGRLCLPIPPFSIGGFAGLGLGLSAPTCTGIPLVNYGAPPSLAPWPQFLPSLMIPAGP